MLYHMSRRLKMKTRNLTTLLALAAAILLAAPLAFAQAQEKDLTKFFRDGGVSVDHLQVVEIGGIVVIRGRTEDSERAAQAGRFAQSLGYSRVANLIQVAEPADDAFIQRRAERELTIHRGLDGTNIQIASRAGVVHLSGRIQSELQRDMAVQLVRNIGGVRSVNAAGLQQR
jgi:osmotically-inducible protein OsmY